MLGKTLIACAAILTMGALTVATVPAQQTPPPIPTKPAAKPVAKSTVPQPPATTIAPPATPTTASAPPPRPVPVTVPLPNTCALPAAAKCLATAGSCTTQQVCCKTPQGTEKCATAQTSNPATCLPGYYGANCMACPGGASNVCSGNGACSQNVAGSGLCTCNAGFTGAACQNKTSQ